MLSKLSGIAQSIIQPPPADVLRVYHRGDVKLIVEPLDSLASLPESRAEARCMVRIKNGPRAYLKCGALARTSAVVAFVRPAIEEDSHRIPGEVGINGVYVPVESNAPPDDGGAGINWVGTRFLPVPPLGNAGEAQYSELRASGLVGLVLCVCGKHSGFFTKEEVA